MKRDLSKPLAPTFNEPKSPTKKQYKAVEKMGAERKTMTEPYLQQKSAQKRKGKNVKAALGAAAGIIGKVAYDAYHGVIGANYANEYTGTGKKAPYGDQPSNKELRKWKKSK
jgi:hypothetical protein